MSGICQSLGITSSPWHHVTRHTFPASTNKSTLSDLVRERWFKKLIKADFIVNLRLNLSFYFTPQIKVTLVFFSFL